jgi:hypothetical protein
MTYSEKIIAFYRSLQPPKGLPANIEVLYPQQHKEVMQLVEIFFTRYYDDDKPRRLMLGINPGRFGAGITGVNFTAPRQLSEGCGIAHSLGNGSELSAEFIYKMIDAYGGATSFYSNYFITSVSPLGYIQGGKNINYYDDKELQQKLKSFINTCLQQQFAMDFKTDLGICIGGEKNYSYLNSWNEQRKQKDQPHFKKLIPLPHPRFIMQYKRKQISKYIDQYLAALI